MIIVKEKIQTFESYSWSTNHSKSGNICQKMLLILGLYYIIYKLLLQKIPFKIPRIYLINTTDCHKEVCIQDTRHGFNTFICLFHRKSKLPK